MGKSLNTSDYSAVLLAAGYGGRISNLTDMPKCLLEINGETLLERNFKIWENLGIKKITLVLGYKSEEILKVSDKYKEIFDFAYEYNTDYVEKGNTFSLLLGIKNVERALIFDADLAYEEIILRKFLEDKEESQILVGPGDIDDIECAKVLVDKENIARMTIDKRAVSADELKLYSFAGEAIGILKFSKELTHKLREQAELFLSNEKHALLNWEHLLNEFLLVQDVSIHQLGKKKWIEIDDESDYKEAMRIFGDQS